MKLKILAAVAVAVVGVGCKSGPDKRVTQFTADQGTFHSDKKGESLETKLAWVKNKPKAVDLSVSFTNHYKKPVLLKIRNFEGDVGGSKPAIIMPDEYVHLAPEQTWTGLVALRFPVADKKRQGQGKLTIPILEATSANDGKAFKTTVIEFPVNPME